MVQSNRALKTAKTPTANLHLVTGPRTYHETFITKLVPASLKERVRSMSDGEIHAACIAIQASTALNTIAWILFTQTH